MLLPDASAAYFKPFACRGTSLDELTDDLIHSIETLRSSIRKESPGGMCEIVSECLRQRHQWVPMVVSYLSEDGRIICADHTVVILPDGSLLDATRDQFGEGHSISLIKAGTQEMGRYRPFFHADWHPGHYDDKDGKLNAWLPTYTGKNDYDLDVEISAQFGIGWWVTDKTLLAKFYQANDYLAGAEALERLSRSPALK
jgi:hypothetical protein